MNQLSRVQLLEHINTTLSKTKIEKLAGILSAQRFSATDLIDLTFDANRKVAFRSAWLLENWFLLAPSNFEECLDYFVEKLPLVTNASCMRHYVKIATHITSPQADHKMRKKLNEINLEPVINTCFTWLIDPNVLVAVKVFAAQTLFNLKDRYEWVGGELKEQLFYLMRNGSAAMQSRGKKLLANL